MRRLIIPGGTDSPGDAQVLFHGHITAATHRAAGDMSEELKRIRTVFPVLDEADQPFGIEAIRPHLALFRL